MTEFEFLTATDAALGFAVEAARFFFTVFAAYVLAAHFAGKSLSKLVAVLISVLYSLFLTGPIAGIFESIESFAHLQTLYFQQYPDGVIVRRRDFPGTVLLITVAPLVLGWFASLFYMHGYVRKTRLDGK